MSESWMMGEGVDEEEVKGGGLENDVAIEIG